MKNEGVKNEKWMNYQQNTCISTIGARKTIKGWGVLQKNKFFSNSTTYYTKSKQGHNSMCVPASIQYCRLKKLWRWEKQFTLMAPFKGYIFHRRPWLVL